MMRIRLCALCALLAFSCVYDPDDRCDEGQREENSLCVCEEGMVPAEVGCKPCGDDETAENGVCVCDEGFARPAPDEPCEAMSADQGVSCDPDEDEPACSGDFPYCQPSEFDVGYCTTSECSDDDDCDGDYLCDERETPSYCARPPIGMGDACESHEDCEGKEASYCVTLQDSGCAVECSDAPCPVGHECCDLEVFGLTMLCVPEGMCPV